MAPLTAGQTRIETGAWTDTEAHKSGFVRTNGIRVNYLDWGGSGPDIVLVPGGNESPHFFDDLAPALNEHFRVVAYARRGHGRSDAKGPFDNATLTEDLLGVMDALGIAKAHLVGHSMGGNEITGMAGTHPERVDHVVYLDAAYDWSDPAFHEMFASRPSLYQSSPASASKSLRAAMAHFRTQWFLSVGDPHRYEAYLRDVIEVQRDGTVRPRMSDRVWQEIGVGLLNSPKVYTKVRSPALAIYARTMHDCRNGGSARVAQMMAWERKYWAPFRAASIERVRQELPDVKVVSVPGNHMDFIFTSRKQVVAAMQRFLRGGR